MIVRILSLVVALWAGSLLTICLIVAPSLFQVLPDRHLAGDLAGHFFRIASWLGLAFGGISLIVLSRVSALATRLNYVLIGITTTAPLCNELVLRPYMEAARATSDMQLFGTLHGVSATLFGVACVTALTLAWRVSRRAA